MPKIKNTSITEPRDALSSKGKEDKKAGFLREIAGIILAGFDIFLLAALISYSPFDPSLNSFDLTRTKNWMGPVGAHLADFLFAAAGLGAWLLAAAATGALLPVFIRDFGKIWRRSTAQVISGFLLIFLGSCIFLGLIEIPSTKGGIIGAAAGSFISGWIGLSGALLVCSVLFFSGFLLAFPFSFSELFSTLKNMAKRRKKEEKTPDISPSVGKTSEKKEADAEEKQEPGLRINAPLKARKRKTEEEEPPQNFDITPVKGEFVQPPLSFLQEPPDTETEIDRQAYIENSKVLEQKLKDFGVAGKVVEICPGPVVTMYEFAPAPGVKINKVASLADDLALALKTHSVRIVAPIPGKAVIGIELANPVRQMVFLKDILASDVFQKGKGQLLLALGQDIVGQPVVTDLARMPHLLIAGATGTGKSVGLNAMICSLLYKMGPDKLRLLMIDPKRIELSLYESIPHLIHPVVSEPKEATKALKWAVLEMERRYQLLEEAHARNLSGYNKHAEEPLPLLVIIIDELADLMMVSSKEVEASIARLAQMARAAGIHLLIATQRPSVDVLTGLIKANFPARLSFKVSSKVDSRTILDVMGAERLLGNGDMLFLPPGSSSLERIHGAYISESEILKIVEFLKAQGEPDYDFSVVEPTPDEKEAGADAGKDFVDEKYDEAVEVVTSSGQASISGLQRRLRIGYNRAARMIEQMEKDGIVTPTDGMGRRQVIARSYDNL